MKNVVQFPDTNAIQETAALWLARLDRGEMSHTQRQELQEWLESDTRHRQALNEMAQLWGQMDALAVLAELFPLQAVNHREHSRPRLSPLAWLREHTLGAAATFAVSASLVMGMVFLLNESPAEMVPVGSEPVELVYQTELGKQSTAELKDGSTMVLNTRSQARVRFDERERAVFLESGEAHFKVAKNPQIPFVVYAGNGQVRAVGTAFSVRIDAEKVNVMVSEGTVKVVAGIKPGDRQEAKVSANHALQTITLSERGVANYRESIEAYTYIEPEQLTHKLAWKSGKWIFEGETLADVIAEANRYTSDTIEIADPTIAYLRVGGYFRAGEVESLLNALEAGFNIVVTRPREGLIQVSSRNDVDRHYQ
ncbi:MAG: FecR domain-containing protein [Pseudomonadota bacterium]|nr:FecR domain-containing protein [Pseudomonadota bacterium]